MRLNYIFDSVEDEAAKKVATMLSPSADVESAFLSECEIRLTKAQVGVARRTLDFAKSIRSEDATHPSIRLYISHPVRVASMVVRIIQDEPHRPTVLGLIHNVYEIGGLAESDLIQADFDRFIADAIRVLTVDRSRQWDPSYLEPYYESIEQFGAEAALVRCLDKLDNLLAFELIREENNRSKYLDLAHRFVVPMAKRLSSDLGDYMGGVIAYMSARGCRPELATQYENHKQAMTREESTTDRP
jgi:(p)ppGpp synthase/HD superfamily hydrolase